VRTLNASILLLLYSIQKGQVEPIADHSQQYHE